MIKDIKKNKIFKKGAIRPFSNLNYFDVTQMHTLLIDIFQFWHSFII